MTELTEKATLGSRCCASMAGEGDSSMRHRFQWSASVNTGIEELDAQHQRLLHLINLLDGTDDEEVDPVILELRRFLHCHFACEEALMEAYSDRHLIDQRRDHVEGMESFEELIRGYERGTVTKDELCELVYRWLVAHTVESDMAMARSVLAVRLAVG